MGVWLITEHMAFTPQEPGQGSMHFSRIQAKLLGHSVLIVHSGRHCGGKPTYPTKQEQEGAFPMFLHCEKGPHGVGTQGSLTTATSVGGGGAVD